MSRPRGLSSMTGVDTVVKVAWRLVQKLLERKSTALRNANVRSRAQPSSSPRALRLSDPKVSENPAFAELLHERERVVHSLILV